MHRFLFLFTTIALFCAAAAKQPKVVKPAGPVHGVKTPGVLIPYESLKAEASIAVAAPPAGMLFTESIAIADGKGIQRLDAKTNAAFEPSRDIAGLDKPCGGLLSAFSFVWTPVCGTAKLAKLEMRPVRTGPARGAGREGKGEAKPEVSAETKPEAKPEVKAEAKPGEPRPERKPEPPPAAPVFIDTGAAPTAVTAIAASEDSVWLLADAKTSLQRIDPIENRVVAEVRLPAGCQSIVSAERALWVACPSEAKLLRIDPRTNLVEKRIEVPAEPVAVAAGESSIWVLSRKEGKVSRIDPKTNKITATIELAIPNAEGTLAFGEGSLWASVPGFPLMRIAPATDKVVQQFHGEGGGVVHFGLGSLWVTSPKGTAVARFDPKRVLATLAD